MRLELNLSRKTLKKIPKFENIFWIFLPTLYLTGASVGYYLSRILKTEGYTQRPILRSIYDGWHGIHLWVQFVSIVLVLLILPHFFRFSVSDGQFPIPLPTTIVSALISLALAKKSA